MPTCSIGCTPRHSAPGRICAANGHTTTTTAAPEAVHRLLVALRPGAAVPVGELLAGEPEPNELRELLEHLVSFRGLTRTTPGAQRTGQP